MKFLVDANLPPRLCTWLNSRGHDADHLFQLGLLRASDTQIWQYGSAEKVVVITKDVDFYDRALVFGPPPQVIHIAVGNCSNDRLFEILASKWVDIEMGRH